VAIGDVHGSYDSFVKVLQLSGLVDARLAWSGGKARLVQAGDVLDRGPKARMAMDLLMRLEREARQAGGRVHALLGNHEVMNLLGDLRYATPADYEAFRTPGSEKLREETLRAALERAREQAKADGQPFDEAAYRAEFLKQVPLGFIEHRQAFSAEGTYGRWLRGHDVLVKIDDVVFVHGGLTPAVAALGCEAINSTVRKELNEDFEKTRSEPLQTLSAGAECPLWFRGMAREEEAAFAPQLDAVLKSLGARAVVIAHTPTGDGRIQQRFGGRVLMIDVGMLAEFGGHLAALEIGPRGTAALYPTGREALPALANAARAPWAESAPQTAAR
jgi:hypothetical protein